MKKFRLIGLCNVIYKGISKLIVNRIKSIMLDLVAPNQVSFMPRRHSVDNVVKFKKLSIL